MRLFLLALALAGCKAGDVCRPGKAEPVYGIASSIVFARADDHGVSAGFDLDGTSSSEGGSSGCGIADYTDPDGKGGVDNAFARIIPALELTEAAAVEGIIQESINRGDLILLFGVHGLQDAENDDCVDVEMLRGEAPVTLGTDQKLEWWQTVERDDSAPETIAEGVAVVNGTALATGLSLELPVTIFGVDFVFQVYDAAVRIDLEEDGSMHGWLGGGLDAAALIEVAQTENVDPALAGILETLLDLNSDLAPDDGGDCTQVSITFEWTAAPAFVLE